MNYLVLSSWLIFVFDIYWIGKALELRPIKAKVDGRFVRTLISLGVVVPWMPLLFSWLLFPTLYGIGPLAGHLVVSELLYLLMILVFGLLNFKLSCSAHLVFWRLEGLLKFTAIGTALGFLTLYVILYGWSMMSLVVLLLPLVIHLWASLCVVRTLKLSFKASGINGPEDLKSYIVKDPLCRWWLRIRGRTYKQRT